MTHADGSVVHPPPPVDIRLQREREAAILEERSRLARDIHDTLAQAFVGIAIQLESAEELVYSDAESAIVHLRKARRLALDSIAEARRTIAALRPPALDDADLPTALANSVEQIMEGTSLGASFVVDGEHRPLPYELETELLRVAQEALTNVLKHAHATEVQVRLTFAPEELQLCIEDNGTGFNISSAISYRKNSSYGILGMRERIERIQGHIEFLSAPAHGTRITVSVPLPNISQFSPPRTEIDTTASNTTGPANMPPNHPVEQHPSGYGKFPEDVSNDFAENSQQHKSRGREQ